MKCSKNFCYAIMIKMKFCALVFVFIKYIYCLQKEQIVKSVEIFPPHGSQINPRYSPFFQYFSDDGKPSIFVYGGVDYKDDILSDAYVITLEPLFVTLIQIPLESKKPTVKFFAQFSFNNTLYIWGGCQDSRISNELWSYNFSSHEWKEMDQGDLIPEGRYSMAYATGDNRLYIFGGISANGLLNDLWEFDIQTKQWRALKIDSGANDPEPCSGAGMFISNEYAVVFGGDTDREEVYTIKMFRVKIDVISPQSWEEVKIANLDGSESIIPVSRSNFGHATRVISNETFLYLFGGWKSNSLFDGCYSILLFNCSQVGCDVKGRIIATYKEIKLRENPQDYYLFGNCGCTIDEEGNVFILGGRMNSSLYSDLIAMVKDDLSFKITTKEINSEEAYERRERFKKKKLHNEGNSSIFERLGTKRSEIFPSFSKRSNERSRNICELENNNSSHFLSMDSSSTVYGIHFIWLTNVHDLSPSPRVNPIVGVYNGFYFVYGGRNPISGEIFSDVYLFSPEYHIWSKFFLNVSSETPPARELASCCVDNDRILLFGGLGQNQKTGKEEPSNELWEYSFSALSWRQLGKNSFIKPTPVYGASAAMYIDYLIIAGGKKADGTFCESSYIFNFASDKWELHVANEKFFKSSVLVKKMLPKSKKNISFSEQKDIISGIHFQNKTNSLKSNSNDFDKLLTDKEKSSRDTSLDISASSSRRNQILFLFGGDVGTRPFFGINGKNIYEQFSKSKNGSKSENQNSTEKSLPIHNNELHINDFDDIEFHGNFGGVALSFDNIIMMFGGRKRNVAQDTFKFIRIFENWTFNAFEDNGTFLANKMHLDIVEAGCTVHDRKVICFGGRQIDEKRTIMPAALDTFRIIRLNENLVPCSPGYYLSKNGNCELCENGKFTDIYGKNECEKCPLGTYRNLNGSIVPNCLPVPAGKFTNTEGAYVIYNESYGIENCTEDQYCPIGSASTNNKDPHLETLRNEQPKPLELNSMKEIGLMVGLYLGSIFVGVVVVLILLCLPTKSYLYKLDNYSDKYVDSLDRDTHSAIKHIKKTTFGGSVSIVAIFFVIGALVSVLLTFSFFNTNETRTTLDVSMDENADVSKITNKQVKLELILKDYTGYCIGPPKDTDRKQSGKCSDYLGLGKTTFDAFDWYDNSNQNENVNVSIECTQVPSINHFHTYTHDCEITLTAKDVKLFFENSQAMFFSLFSSEREASCRAIKVHASVDSAVPKQKKKKGELDNYQSIIEDIFVSDEEHVLHGSNPSNITIELIPSIFKDETKKKKEEQLGKGHLINHISFECGSLANSLNIFSTMGFGFNVFLKLEKTVAITQRSYKITFGMLITSLGGTFVYLGYFGNILPIFETLMNVNWPCGRRMKKKISSVFHDSSKKLSRRSAYREYEEEMKTALDEHIT